MGKNKLIVFPLLRIKILFPGLLILITLCISQLIKAQCNILSTGSVLSTSTQSWGQSFIPSCDKQIHYIVFNALGDVNSSFTLTIRDGSDCSSPVLATQKISEITDGDNKVDLITPLSVTAGKTYYFSVESDANINWRIRFNLNSQVAGNLKTHSENSPKTSCDWDFPDFDWAFSIDTVIPAPNAPVLEDSVDLFILGGQSNAQGWMGDGAQYPQDTTLLDPFIGLYYHYALNTSSNGKWISMQAQEGLFPEGHFGPEVSFGRRLKASGYNPVIFKYTCGGTSIDNYWKTPGSGGQYDALVVALKKAIRALEQNGHTVAIRAFIWIQGESDMDGLAMANAYHDKLLSIIRDMRINVAKNSTLPILLGVDEQYPSGNAPIIIAAQKKIASDEANVMFTSMIGLPKADVTHLTPAGLYTHGIRLYNAFRTLDTFTGTHNPQIAGYKMSVINNTVLVSIPDNAIDVSLYDLSGRLVANEFNAFGNVNLQVVSGFYIAVVKVNGETLTRKIITF